MFWNAIKIERLLRVKIEFFREIQIELTASGAMYEGLTEYMMGCEYGKKFCDGSMIIYLYFSFQYLCTIICVHCSADNDFTNA